MRSINRTVLFVALTTILALAVIPVGAQVTTLKGTCGFPGFPDCTGSETFTGTIQPWVIGVINIFVGLIGTIAAIFLIYAAVRYISSAGREEAAAQAKRQVLYAILGIILAFGAFVIVNAVIPDPDPDAQPIIDYVMPFVNAFLALIGTIAAIFLIVAGTKYISSSGDEQRTREAKQQVIYALIGLILAGGAFILVNAVQAVDPDPIEVYVLPFVNMALSLFGLATAIYIIFAGYKYINSQGNEESATTAKRQLTYAILGLIVAGLAFTIVNTVLTLNTVPLTTDILNIVNAALTLVGIAAGIYLILAGAKYIASSGDEQRAQEAKQQIIYAIIGIVITGLAFMIVNAVITLDTVPLINTLQSITNAFLGFVAIVAGIYLVIAGVMYIASQGDAEAANRARMQIIYAVIGLVVVAAAAVLVNFIINAIP